MKTLQPVQFFWCSINFTKRPDLKNWNINFENFILSLNNSNLLPPWLWLTEKRTICNCLNLVCTFYQNRMFVFSVSQRQGSWKISFLKSAYLRYSKLWSVQNRCPIFLIRTFRSLFRIWHVSNIFDKRWLSTTYN